MSAGAQILERKEKFTQAVKTTPHNHEKKKANLVQSTEKVLFRLLKGALSVRVFHDKDFVLPMKIIIQKELFSNKSPFVHVASSKCP